MTLNTLEGFIATKNIIANHLKNGTELNLVLAFSTYLSTYQIYQKLPNLPNFINYKKMYNLLIIKKIACKQNCQI